MRTGSISAVDSQNNINSMINLVGFLLSHNALFGLFKKSYWVFLSAFFAHLLHYARLY